MSLPAASICLAENCCVHDWKFYSNFCKICVWPLNTTFRGWEALGSRAFICQSNSIYVALGSIVMHVLCYAFQVIYDLVIIMSLDHLCPNAGTNHQFQLIKWDRGLNMIMKEVKKCIIVVYYNFLFFDRYHCCLLQSHCLTFL